MSIFPEEVKGLIELQLSLVCPVLQHMIQGFTLVRSPYGQRGYTPPAKVGRSPQANQIRHPSAVFSPQASPRI